MAPSATYSRAFDHVGVIGTYLDLETYQKHEFRLVSMAERHAQIQSRYVDVIIVERFL
jgi:hypothetical protein